MYMKSNVIVNYVHQDQNQKGPKRRPEQKNNVIVNYVHQN